MKKIILLALLIVVGIFGASQMVCAANSVLSPLPVSLDSTVNTSFNISVKIDPVGNKVCLVKGTVNFSNLTCKNITVASGVMAQTIPTCTNPSFTLGIPKCTTVAKDILSVAVAGSNVGQASLFFTNVRVIGPGTNVAFTSQNGIYGITAVPTETSEPESAPVTNTDTVNQQTNETIQGNTTQSQTPQPTNKNSLTNGLQASLLNASPSKTVVVIGIILLIIFIILGLWYSISKKKKKE